MKIEIARFRVRPGKPKGSPPRGGYRMRDASGDWEEGKHPRADNGQFGSGGGGGKSSGGKKKELSSQTPNLYSPAIGRDEFQKKGGAAAHNDKHLDKNASAETVLKKFPADVKQRIEENIQRLKTTTPTNEKYKRGQEYIDARVALHDRIILNGVETKRRDPKTGAMVTHTYPGLLSDGEVEKATPPEGQAPKFVMLGGRGGSGKSSLKGKVYDDDNSIVLDADHIKGLLPEYEGWNAGQVHEESSDILDRVIDLARKAGLNIVLDATMKTPHKAIALAKLFKDSGYEVEAHYMYCPAHIASERAINRSLSPSSGGRLVDPAIIFSNKNNEEAFDAVREISDDWSFWDNSGNAPYMVSRKKGEKSEE